MDLSFSLPAEARHREGRLEQGGQRDGDGERGPSSSGASSVTVETDSLQSTNRFPHSGLIGDVEQRICMGMIICIL